MILHGEKNLVLNAKSGFCGMVGLVCRLEAVVKVKLPDMGLNLRGHCLFIDLGQEVWIGYWVVVSTMFSFVLIYIGCVSLASIYFERVPFPELFLIMSYRILIF